MYNDVILLLQPESLRILLSCANYGFCYLNLDGLTKLKYEKKNRKDSGHCSKMMPSCKWPTYWESTKCNPESKTVLD